MRRFGLGALSVGLSLLAAPAAAQQPSPEYLISDAAAAAQDYDAARRCGWASASEGLLLQNRQQETRANLIGLYPDQAAALDSKVADAEKDADCGHDPELALRRQRLTAFRSIAYIRASAILNLEQWLSYAAHLSELGSKKDAIRRVVDDIERKVNLMFAWPDTIATMRGTLADLCQERRSVRWAAGERPCPKLSVAENERQFGAMVAKNIERFIAADDAPLPPDQPPAWSVSFPAGKASCHIERREGATVLSGDAGDGGVFSFGIGSELPVSGLPKPAHIALEGHVGVDGLAAIVVERARVDFPGAGAADGRPELSFGKMKFAPEVEGTALLLDLRHDNHPELTLLGAALIATPHVSAVFPAADGRKEVDADVPDLAALLRDLGNLRQAYRLCWH